MPDRIAAAGPIRLMDDRRPIIDDCKTSQYRDGTLMTRFIAIAKRRGGSWPLMVSLALLAAACGGETVSDWPLLNALLNCASGATWVSLHHGGGVGMGFSQHAGMVICADGSDDAAKRIERVLWNDPASGVMRHADAGYEIAQTCAREQGLNLPSL